MFRQLTDFSIQRNKTQVIGFWIAYLLLGFIIGAIIVGTIVVALGAKNYEEGYKIGYSVGEIFSVIYVSALSIMVCAKKSMNFVVHVVSIIASALLTLFFGAFIGLMFTALLTRRPDMKRQFS